ncbi:MAG: MBL fold metallo-hydrolase [Bacteroidales bacterium]|nr:MBL fold metallo-hydrolase [Bacteroidales bacterium]
MNVDIFNIANFRVDGGAMFGVVPKALWSRVYGADVNNLIVLTLRSLIVETEGRNILVDTGWGDKQDEKFFRHTYIHDGEGLLEGLRKRGLEPEDITDVVLTHLHADHCGGGVVRSSEGAGFELTFPNAIYHVSRTQWEWAVRNNPREEDAFLEENILPIGDSGHLNLVDEDCELFEGFSVRIYYGHTPGLMIPFIKYKGKTLVYTGDLIPTIAHLPLIWNMSYDIESLRTIDEKSKLLEEALAGNYILVFQHDVSAECCTLRMTEKGIRAGEKGRLADLLGK